MASLAIIGTGISGLACGHFLHSKFDLSVYEQNEYVGGHSHTVTVQEAGQPIPIDTGFMVYNEVTYPNLTRLFRDLGVRSKPTDMSFSVQHRPSGLDYKGAALNFLFGQRRNLLNARFWRLLFQINRFNSHAIQALDDPKYASHTIRQYVDERRYGTDLLNLFLVPMSSAVWSTPPELTLEFPAVTLLRFFHNHGFLGMQTQHPWLTLVGGARSYVDKIIEPYRNKVYLRKKTVGVTREKGKVQVFAADGTKTTHDKVIFACHADQTLALLGDATDLERKLLGEFKYQQNTATLHTDSSFMPKTRRCWASWNYLINRKPNIPSGPSVHYWMNSLQGVSNREDYFVSLNVRGQVPPEKVLKEIDCEHPLFSQGAIRAQQDLPGLNRINGARTTLFCGSYFKYGFHEDGFNSALDCVHALTGTRIWN